jgi:hypothetical protein
MQSVLQQRDAAMKRVLSRKDAEIQQLVCVCGVMVTRMAD